MSLRLRLLPHRSVDLFLGYWCETQMIEQATKACGKLRSLTIEPPKPLQAVFEIGYSPLQGGESCV